MDERTHGLILRTRPLTETSLIIQWLTPDLGRVATVAKGARRPKSAFRGKLDLFYEADFSFARSRRSELHNLREVVLQNTRPTLRQNLDWLEQASYFTTLVEQTTETETPIPEIYELVRSALDQLTQESPSPRMVFAFELKLLHELGLAPNAAEAKLAEGTRQLLNVLASGTWSFLAKVRLSEMQVRELRQFLQGYLIYHLERIPTARTAALKVD